MNIPPFNVQKYKILRYNSKMLLNLSFPAPLTVKSVHKAAFKLIYMK